MKKAVLFLLILMLFAGSASAMTEDEAQTRITEVDPAAGNAVNIAAFPSNDADGAFVVVMTGYEDAYFSGTFWYVTADNAAKLGSGSGNWSFGIIGSEPEVFFNSYGPPESRRTRACILKDGNIAEIQNAADITFCEIGNRITAMIDHASQDCDYAFLRVCFDDSGSPYLAQLRGFEIPIERFLYYDTDRAITKRIDDAGFTIDRIFCRDRDTFSVNLIRSSDGAPFYTYVFCENGSLYLPGGAWEEDFLTLSGSSTPVREGSLPVIEIENVDAQIEGIHFGS